MNNKHNQTKTQTKKKTYLIINDVSEQPQWYSQHTIFNSFDEKRAQNKLKKHIFSTPNQT